MKVPLWAYETAALFWEAVGALSRFHVPCAYRSIAVRSS